MSTRFRSFSRFGLAMVLLAMLIGGVTLVAAQDGPTSDPTDPLIAYVQGWYDTVIAPTENVSREDAAAYRSPSFIWHEPGSPAVSVSEDMYWNLEFSNFLRVVATDSQFAIERVVRYGDLVWGQYTHEFTLQEPLAFEWALEPWSHIQLPLDLHAEGVFIARIEDGKFAEWWEYTDNPLLNYALQYFLCTGYWEPPLAASDLPPGQVASVPDHTLLMDGEKITLVQQLIDRTINAFERNYATMLKTSVIMHEPRGPEVRVVFPASIRKWFEALHEMMPDYRMEIQHIVELDDMVWMHWRATGTLTNPSTDPGLIAVNSIRMPRAVEMEGVYVFRFERNKIAEWWWYEDNGLLTQTNRGLCLSKP